MAENIIPRVWLIEERGCFASLRVTPWITSTTVRDWSSRCGVQDDTTVVPREYLFESIVFPVMIRFAVLVRLTLLTFRHALSSSFHLAPSMIVEQCDAPRAREREKETHTMEERFFKSCLLLLLSRRSRACKRAWQLWRIVEKKETFNSNGENLLSSMEWRFTSPNLLVVQVTMSSQERHPEQWLCWRSWWLKVGCRLKIYLLVRLSSIMRMLIVLIIIYRCS